MIRSRSEVFDPELRGALLLWTLLGLVICIKVGIQGSEHSLYPVFAGAARHWWADQPIYADYLHSAGIDAYRYSPTFAVAFTPFYVLGDRLGGMAWTVVSMGLLVWGLRVFVRDVLPGDWPPHREGLFLLLVLVGSAVGLWSIHSNAIVLAAMLFGLAAVRRECWWTAAWTLALAVFVKIWPVALVLLIVACWPRRFVLRFAAVCAMLAAVPFLTRSPATVVRTYEDWYAVTVCPHKDRWPGYRDAWTVWARTACLITGQGPAEAADRDAWLAWDERHPPVSPQGYMALQLGAAVLTLGWCLWQRRRLADTGPLGSGGPSAGPAPRRFLDNFRAPPLSPERTARLLTLMFSIWVAWQLLFGPATEQLTYPLAAPAASWALLTSFAEKKARWLTVTCFAVLAILPSGDIERLAVLLLHGGGMVLLPLAVLLLVAWLVWRERGPIAEAV